MSVLVHNISGSPMGWRVLLGLAFKGIDYKVNYLNGTDKEHKQALRQPDTSTQPLGGTDGAKARRADATEQQATITQDSLPSMSLTEIRRQGVLLYTTPFRHADGHGDGPGINPNDPTTENGSGVIPRS